VVRRRDPDVAAQALSLPVTELSERLPRIANVVQLHEIDAGHVKARERAPELIDIRRLGLGRQKEPVAQL